MNVERRMLTSNFSAGPHEDADESNNEFKWSNSSKAAVVKGDVGARVTKRHITICMDNMATMN